MSMSYVRSLGYVTMIALYAGNGLYMRSCITPSALEDPDVKKFSELQYRYLTCWNFLMIIFYGMIGLACEVLAGMNSELTKSLSKLLNKVRDTFFACIIFPATLIVVSIFWTFFLYDRNLILPAYIDKILTRTSNHIIHTSIVGAILWEAVVRRRSVPTSHKFNLFVFTMFGLVYSVTLFQTYYDMNHWLYPIFGITYDIHPICFVMFALSIYAAGILYYYTQWAITYLVWGSKKKKYQKIK